MKILSVLKATNRLRQSPEFELYELTAKNAEMFDEVASKQTGVLLDGQPHVFNRINAPRRARLNAV